MTTKIFSVLNQNALGPGLVLDQGGLTITTTQDSLNKNRKALGTVPRGVGELYYEAAFYSTLRAAMPVGCRIGVAWPRSTLTTCAGDDAGSIAYEPITGNIFNNGAVLATVDASLERRIIGIHITFDVSNRLKFGIAIEGNFQVELTTAINDELWVPCVTVCGSNAADMNAYVNSGIRGFRFPRVVAGV